MPKKHYIIYLSVLCVAFCLFFGQSASVSAAIQTMTLQPGPGLNDGTDDGSADKGKDASAYEPLVGDYYPQLIGDAYLFNSTCNPVTGNAYLQFSLAGMPAQNIESAKIEIYAGVYFNGNGWPWSIDPIISARAVTQLWSEIGMNWYNQPVVEAPTVDSNQVAIASNYGIPFEGWLEYDITDLYKNWVSGAKDNNGVQFHTDNAMCLNGDIVSFRTSDSMTDPSLRPKLVVEYDDGYAPVCTDNDRDGYFVGGGVCGLVDCNDGNPAINPGAADISCDGVDNNCNGQIDEGYVSIATTCGIGECAATGQKICVTGSEINTCQAKAPTQEVCDGKDNNCNGKIDETIAGDPTDADGDGVRDCNGTDKCLGTAPWYAQNGLNPNHFDSSNMDLAKTFGCAGNQILAKKPGNNNGELKNGLAKGTLDNWISQSGWAKQE